MAMTEAIPPGIRKRALRLLGFVELVAFIAVVEFIALVEFLGLIEFNNLNFKGTKEKIRRTVNIPYRGIWRRL